MWEHSYKGQMLAQLSHLLPRQAEQQAHAAKAEAARVLDGEPHAAPADGLLRERQQVLHRGVRDLGW
jgi:hypothetical protein